MLYNKLKESVLEESKSCKVVDLRIGLRYTIVELDNGACGVAYTPASSIQGCSCRYAGPQGIEYIDQTAESILCQPFGENVLDNAILIALMNALTNKNRPEFTYGDVVEEFEVCDTDKVCMIGHFRPVEMGLKGRVKDICIIEKKAGPAYKSEQEYASVVKESDIAIITATSIIYNDFELLITQCQHCREVVLLGPSTPLAPEIFKEYGVTLLSGMLIKDSEKMKHHISLAHGTRSFKDAVYKVNIKL